MTLATSAVAIRVELKASAFSKTNHVLDHVRIRVLRSELVTTDTTGDTFRSTIAFRNPPGCATWVGGAEQRAARFNRALVDPLCVAGPRFDRLVLYHEA